MERAGQLPAAQGHARDTMVSPFLTKSRGEQSSQTRKHVHPDEDLREEAQERCISLWEKETCQQGMGRGLIGAHRDGHNLSGWEGG